ncbi:TPA: hypothetical protein HA251_08225 [Candidatus Woesearchaeota archaeon]|nr:hypothetical protein [Candidatus Woesearchaeota archaeon]
MRSLHHTGLGIIRILVQNTTDRVDVHHIDAIERHPRTLYISNHMDIVREAAIINYALAQNDLPLAHLAAGDNLFKNRIIRPLLALQPLFPVPRGKGQGLAIAAAVEAQLSQGNHTWVAQGPGRSRSGRIETHPNLLINLAAAHGTSIAEYLAATNVVPVSVSAEYEPAAKQMAYLAAGKTKSKVDDLSACASGIFGSKGRISIAFMPRIRHADSALEASAAVDKAIIGGYELYPTHIAAYKERSRVPIEEWSTYPVDTRALDDAYIVEQVRNLPAAVAPHLVMRYAMPVLQKKQDCGSKR